MNRPPCPVCDVLRDVVLGQKIDDSGDRIVLALAIGVALGNSHANTHDVTRLVCEPHRVRWVRGMLNAAVLANAETSEVPPMPSDPKTLTELRPSLDALFTLYKHIDPDGDGETFADWVTDEMETVKP